MVDRNRHRSDAYQFIFAESLCSPQLLGEVSDCQGLTARLNSSVINEEMCELKEQLRECFWRLVGKLTKRQQEVIVLMSNNKTQMEIAKLLKINQSSISKSWSGNVSYSDIIKDNKPRKVYGGSAKHLKKLAAEDQEVQTILKKMAELNDSIE